MVSSPSTAIVGAVTAWAALLHSPVCVATQDGVPVLALADLGVEFRFAYGEPDRPYVVDSGGAGAAWLDYDLDGRLDLLLLNGLPGPSAGAAQATAAAQAGAPLPESHLQDGSLPTHALLRAVGAGGFARAPTQAGLAEAAWSSAAAVADVDNDGFPDIYVTAIGSNRFYRNNGDGTFAATPSGIEHPGYGTGAAFVPWAGGDRLDLYLANYVEFDAATTATLGDDVCNYLGVEVFCGPAGLTGQQDVLYRNTGDGRFEPWHGLDVDLERAFGFTVLPFDCNGDHFPEIYVANDSSMNLLYALQQGAIDDLSLFSGAGFGGGGLEQAGMGASSADYDGDGDFDLLVTNFQHDYNTLYENLGDCSFVDVTADRGLAAAAYPYMGWAGLFLDIDGDADLDVFVANGHLYPQLQREKLEPFGQRNLLFVNRLRERGVATFEELGASAGTGMEPETVSRSAIAGDFDDDGDADLLVTRLDGTPTLLRNDTVARYPALRLTLVGRQANRSAYGATVRVDSGDSTQSFEIRHGDGYLGSNDTRLLVYLPGGQADGIEIYWPGNSVERLGRVEPGAIVVHQGRGVTARRGW